MWTFERPSISHTVWRSQDFGPIDTRLLSLSFSIFTWICGTKLIVRLSLRLMDSRHALTRETLIFDLNIFWWHLSTRGAVRWPTLCSNNLICRLIQPVIDRISDSVRSWDWLLESIFSPRFSSPRNASHSCVLHPDKHVFRQSDF